MSSNLRQGDEKFVLGSTEYWFELAASGALGFASDSPFAPKTTSGERSYADYDPYSAVAFADLSSGMGQERATDTTRYYDAYNADARGGRIILGPLVHYNADTLPGLATHADELLRHTNTVGELEFVAIDSSLTKRAAKFTVPAGITGADRFWLPLKAYATAGTVTVKVYNDAAGLPGTEAGSTTVSRDELQPFGAWAQVSFSPSLTLAAGSSYWISVEHSGATNTVFWYGGYAASDYSAYANAATYESAAWAADGTHHLILVYDDPATRPDSSLRFIMGAGEDNIPRMWGYSGKRLYYIGSDGLPAGVQDGAGNVYQCTAEIKDAAWFRSTGAAHASLYLALGDSTDLVSFDGNIGAEQWTTATGHQARLLTVHDNMLWFADEVNAVGALGIDGTTWGATATVGDKTYPIRNMLSWAGSLYLGKDDGLYKATYATGYPTSGTPTVTKILDFTSMANNNNFAAMCEHQGDLVFSLERGLLRFTNGNVLTPISPDTGLNLSADERCVYRAAHSSLNVLWVCAEGSLAGRSTLMALVDWHWHPIVTVPRYGDMMRSVHVEPGLYGASPRVWFKAGLQVAYVNMPTTTQKRWLWSDMDYCTQGHVDLPWVDGGIRTIPKDWIAVEVDARNCQADRTPPDYGNRIEVYYREDEDDAWTSLGHVHAEGITTLPFPANTYGAKVQLRVELWTANGANPLNPPPQCEAIVLKYMERPEDAVAFTRTYILGERNPDPAGARGRRSLAQSVAVLETLRESAEPLTFYPWWGIDDGVTYSVHVVNYSVTERRAERRVKPAGSMYVTLKLQKV